MFGLAPYIVPAVIGFFAGLWARSEADGDGEGGWLTGLTTTQWWIIGGVLAWLVYKGKIKV
ncbi:MAG: hypothetical protein ACPGO3_13315 [Magnetospiraceae bacterium]